MTGPVLEVDLEALARNLRRIRTRIAPAEHMLVVKDDAYGHGLGSVVERARREGVRWFGAFDLAGAELVRAQAPAARVFTWLTVGAGEIDRARELHLDIGVGDADLLEEVAASTGPHAARVHLKIDSGLHRNGIRPEQWPATVERAASLVAQGRIVVEGIWSHIAEASDAEDDRSRRVFDDAVRTARQQGLSPSWRHLSASAASFARAEFRYDLARIGAFAYGIRPAGGPDDAELGIEQISQLRAPVVGVDLDGVRVGIGSGHGLPSILAGRMSVSAGVRRVAMRRIGLNVSVVDAWPGARLGDEVVVWGPGAEGVTDLAERIDTIGEEIAVRLARRVPRRYR